MFLKNKVWAAADIYSLRFLLCEVIEFKIILLIFVITLQEYNELLQ